MAHDIDLIPRENEYARRQAARAVSWMIVCGVGLLVIAMVATYLWTDVAKRQGRLAALQNKLIDMRIWEQRVPALTEQLDTLQQKRQFVEGLLQEPDWTTLLADLTNATSIDIRLTEAVFQRDLDRLEEGGPQTAELRLAGEAISSEELVHFMREYAISDAVDTLELEMSAIASSRGNGSHTSFSIRGVSASVGEETE